MTTKRHSEPRSKPERRLSAAEIAKAAIRADLEQLRRRNMLAKVEKVLAMVEEMTGRTHLFGDDDEEIKFRAYEDPPDADGRPQWTMHVSDEAPSPLHVACREVPEPLPLASPDPTPTEPLEAALARIRKFHGLADAPTLMAVWRIRPGETFSYLEAQDLADALAVVADNLNARLTPSAPTSAADSPAVKMDRSESDDPRRPHLAYHRPAGGP